MSDDKTKIVVVRNRPGNPGFKQILKEVMEAAKEGYVVDDTAVGIYTGPLTQGTWRIALVKEGVAEDEGEALHVLEDPKSTKSELLDYAKEIGVEVPKDKKSPAAIKKFLKELPVEESEEEKAVDTQVVDTKATDTSEDESEEAPSDEDSE